MSDLDFGVWRPLLLHGLWVTFYVTVLGAAVALVLAFVLGLAGRSRHLLVRGVVRFLVEFFRGTSLLVQLFWIYYALPQITGWYSLSQSGTIAAVAALGLNFGAYGSEIVRGSINAVPQAQWEGAQALNFSGFQRMRLVILPQAIPLMIPPYGNMLIQLLKSSPLVALVAVLDVYYQANQYWEQEAHPAFIFGLLLVVYFVMAYAGTLGVHVLERQAQRRVGRDYAPSMLRRLTYRPKREGVSQP